MNKAEQYVMDVLKEAEPEHVEYLTKMLHQPLISLYMMDGPIIQALHRVYMRTIFKHRAEYREIVDGIMEEMAQAENAPPVGDEEE